MPVISARTTAPQVLSNLAFTKWLSMRDEMIFNRLAVVTPVSVQEGYIEVFGKEFFIPNADVQFIRTARVKPFSMTAGTTLVPFTCLDRSLGVARDRELEIQKALLGGLQDPLKGDVAMVTRNVAYGVQNTVLSEATGVNVTNTASPAVKWNDYGNAAYNPIGNIDARCAVMRPLTGVTKKMLTAFMDFDVANALRQSPEVRQVYFQGAAAATELDDEQLAKALGVKEVVVSSGLHTTGGIEVFDLGTTVVLAYVNTEAQGEPGVTVYPTAIRWLQYKDISYTAYPYNVETRVEGGDVSYFGTAHVGSYDLIAKLTSVLL